MPHGKYAPQSVLGNSNYTQYYDRSVITYPTVYNNRPYTVTLDKPSKEHVRAGARTHTHTYTQIYILKCLTVTTLRAPSPRSPGTIQT